MMTLLTRPTLTVYQTDHNTVATTHAEVIERINFESLGSIKTRLVHQVGNAVHNDRRSRCAELTPGYSAVSF